MDTKTAWLWAMAMFSITIVLLSMVGCEQHYADVTGCATFHLKLDQKCTGTGTSTRL